jgi:transcriptional regulator with XRE-family HTH domain
VEEIIHEISLRLKGMRDTLDITAEDMAEATGVSLEEYLSFESGERDFPFTFLYKAANRFGITLTDLMTGESPHLSTYTLVRKNEGLPIVRREGFSYLHVAAHFRDRIAEPFVVEAPYQPGAEDCELLLNSHVGQELDYILEGQLRVRIGDHEELMQAGDTIYYDASSPHGMVAVGGKPCRFLAVVMGQCDED